MNLSLEDFLSRLAAVANELGWHAGEEAVFAADRFRGREMKEDTRLPAHRLGARLGPYPVILSQWELEQPDRDQLRALHAQVLIARSYLPAPSIVDIHLFLLVRAEALTAAQWSILDRIQRDETICRKQVCVIGSDVEGDFSRFVERTFLARPWAAATNSPRSFQLDRPAALVREILMRQGLAEAIADRWVQLADEYLHSGTGDPECLVDSLVAAMEPNDE